LVYRLGLAVLVGVCFFYFMDFGAGAADSSSKRKAKRGDEVGVIQTDHEIPASNLQPEGLPDRSTEALSAAYQQETEPNNTAGAATLVSTPARIQAALFPNGDIDYYSFTANAGDRVYATTMTSWSAGSSTDSQLELFASDGTTVIEFDDDNGSFAGLSSSIAGATIPSAGTYFLRVDDFTAGTTSERPYELYIRVQSGAPTLETEPNNSPATANPLPAGGWVSGARDPAVATEQDWFSMNLNAGDTVYFGLDLDPERDGVSWNGRLGIALFGDMNNQILVVDDAGAAEVPPPTIPSEAHFFTIKTTGTYFAFVDSATATTGGPTATYNLSVTVFPKVDEGVTCTTYTSTNVPQAIGPGAGLVSSTLTVPGNPRIADLDVLIDLNHGLMNDLDIHLRSPAGNDNGLFTDIGAAATGGQSLMDLALDDDAAIPFSFTVMRPLSYKPEGGGTGDRLHWFDGEDAGGTWTLDIRDDLANASGGTLNSWGLRICEQAVPPGTQFYLEDFESSDGGYTHSGTADEWELGLPATAATTTANPVAAFSSCNSGTNCWKTDLDNTYNVSSNQDLRSPPLPLTRISGPITLEWSMRYQMENATFDHARVIVQQVGNPASARVVWEFLDQTMTSGVGNPAVNIGESAGWGRYRADISSFAGQTIEVIFHVDSDTSINLGGLAIDDVSLYGVGPTAADVSVGGRVTNARGRGIGGVLILMTAANGERRHTTTDSFGRYRFDSVSSGETYVFSARSRRYSFGNSPQVVAVNDNTFDINFVADQ
jgi:subtilisin-like proprotein convertase family protein